MLPVARIIAPVAMRVIETSDNSTAIGGRAHSNDDGVVAGQTENDQIPYQATLGKCPESLFVLWQEFEFGIGGRKPAKLFSTAERDKVRYSYSLRKHFWTLI